MKLSELKSHLDLPDDYEVGIGKEEEGFVMIIKSGKLFSSPGSDGVQERKLYFR